MYRSGGGREEGLPFDPGSELLLYYWEGARESSARIIKGMQKQNKTVRAGGAGCGWARDPPELGVHMYQFIVYALSGTLSPTARISEDATVRSHML